MAVRRESVVLDLQTNFPIESAKAAAALQLLRNQVSGLKGDFGGLDRTSDQAVKGLQSTGTSARRASGDLKGAGGGVDDLTRKMRSGGAEIDRYSGRLRLVTDLLVMLGPGAVPIGAVAIPAVTGLAAQLGVAALAAGVLLGSFQGVGDALKAVNEAAIEPTAANLDKARAAMEQLSPAAQDMVTRLQAFIPELRLLRDIGAESAFPGLTRGLDELEGALPRVQQLFQAIATEAGDIAGDAGESLASDRYADFLDFLTAEGPEALRQFATATGNVIHAGTEFWEAFDPLNDDFGDWLIKVTGQLSDFAERLPTNSSYQEFVDYIRTNGPQVSDTLGSIVDATTGIVTAAAPLGGPVLSILESFFDAIAAIANSDLGTPIFGAVAAMAALNRVVQVGQRLTTMTFGGPAVTAIKTQSSALRDLRADYAAVAQVRRVTRGGGLASEAELVAGARASERLKGTLRDTAVTAGKTGAALAGLSLATSGAADGIGLTNTASLALLGTMAGPWGAAIGGAAGGLLDLKAAGDDIPELFNDISRALATSDFAGAEAKIAALKKTADDLGKTTGIGDYFSDLAKGYGGFFSGDLAFDGEKFKLSDRASRELSESQRQLQRDMQAANREAARIEGYERQAEAIRQSRTAAAEGARSFLDLSKYVKDANLSMGELVRGYESDLRAMAGMTENLAIAAARGLDPLILQDLQSRGVEGARLLETIVNGSVTQFDRLNRAAAGAGAGVDAYSKATERGTVKTLDDIKALAQQAELTPKQIRVLIRQTGAEPTREMLEEVQLASGKIPRRLTTLVREQGAERAQSTIVALTARYNLTPKQVRTLIRESGAKPTQAAVEAVIREAQRLNGQRPRVQVSVGGVSGALSALASIGDRISALNGRSATVTTYYNTVRGGSADAIDRPGRAAGGQVWASGPQSRGPRDDSIDARLSHREWVHQVAAVDHYGERFMADVNAMRFPKPERYAYGGQVGVTQTFATGGSARKKTPGYVYTAAERRAASREFNIGGLDVEDTKRELKSFADDVRQAGGRVGKNFDALSGRIVKNASAYEKLTETLETTKATQAAAREAGQNAFNNNIFGGNLDQLRLQLQADRNDANTAAAAVAAARSNGLGADFAAGLAGSGNVALAQELSRLSRAETSQFQALYSQRTTAQGGLGNQASAGFQPAIDSLNRQMATNTAVLNQLEAAVERGARNGTEGKARAANTKSKAKG